MKLTSQIFYHGMARNFFTVLFLKNQLIKELYLRF